MTAQRKKTKKKKEKEKHGEYLSLSDARKNVEFPTSANNEKIPLLYLERERERERELQWRKLFFQEIERPVFEMDAIERAKQG